MRAEEFASRIEPVPNAPSRRRLAVAVASVAVLMVGWGMPAAAATEVSGIRFDPAQRVGEHSLELSGLGLHRYRIFIKLYAMALYVDPSLQRGGLTPQVVLEDVPKRLELETFWKIPAHVFQRLTRERIAGAVLPSQYEALEPSIEALNALYEDVEPGDRYTITYLPGRGTELAKNGVPRGVVEGERFARAMFGIWLGDVPMDDGLRARLVGAGR